MYLPCNIISAVQACWLDMTTVWAVWVWPRTERQWPRVRGTRCSKSGTESTTMMTSPLCKDSETKRHFSYELPARAPHQSDIKLYLRWRYVRKCLTVKDLTLNSAHAHLTFMILSVFTRYRTKRIAVNIGGNDMCRPPRRPSEPASAYLLQRRLIGFTDDVIAY